MTTFDAHVVSEAVQVADTIETTADHVATETVLSVDQVGPISEGTHVRIEGTIYAYDDSLTVNDEDAGVTSITLSTGLLIDIPTGTIIESWNPNARDGVGDVICEWQVQVVPDGEDRGHSATLADSLIPTVSGNKPPVVGDSVRVQVEDDSSWLVVNKVGATPGIDPGYLRTGTLSASTAIIAGDETGKRVVMDGTGTPAFEAYDASNTQTVNIDGEDNYMTGTLATAKDGPRVDIGAGVLGTDPTEEVRFPSGAADELGPATIRSFETETLPGVTRGGVEIEGADWDGAHPGSNRPILRLHTATSDGSDANSFIEILADQISASAGQTYFDGPVQVGSIEGDSFGPTLEAAIDGRVTTVGGAAYQPLDADLTAFAALASAANKMPYATGSGTWSLADLTAFARTLLDDPDAAAALATLGAQPLDADLSAIAALTTAADKIVRWTGSGTATMQDFSPLAQSLAAVTTAPNFRTAILAKDKRPGVNTQTANYTIAATDEDVRVQINSATAKTVTLPSDTTAPTLPTNFESAVIRLGAGTVTFVADTGVTIDSRGGLLGINGQYGVVYIKKRASNRWIIWGDLV